MSYEKHDARKMLAMLISSKSLIICLRKPF